MTIRETVEIDLATVIVDDDYRVELTQHDKVMTYSPDQAEALAAELTAIAADARRMLEEHIAETRARVQSWDGTVIL